MSIKTRDFSVPPVIIIGMHRSGTTMVASMLESLGLFIGKEKDINEEALFFLRINEWFFLQSGGSWDNCAPVSMLLENAGALDVAKNHIRKMVTSPLLVSYLGMLKYLKYRRLERLDFQWGWKDPRNTFTLGLWLELFPNAKVIHVYRHGVDVASSLRERMRSLVSVGSIQSGRQDLLNGRFPRRSALAFSPVCMDLERGFDLWCTYMEEARKYSSIKTPFLEIQYEQLLADPFTYLKRLSEFCCLKANDTKIAKIISSIRPERAFAFKTRPETKEFAAKVSHSLTKYGY